MILSLRINLLHTIDGLSYTDRYCKDEIAHYMF